MKKILFVAVSLCFVSIAGAQEKEMSRVLTPRAGENEEAFINDVPGQVLGGVSSGAEMLSQSAYADMDQYAIWRRRARYVNFSYGLQTAKSTDNDMKSSMAVGFEFGRTFYLHKKPIAGILKFGLDWTYLDFNFAKYPDYSASSTSGAAEVDEDGSDINLGIMQLEFGMGAGPSVTLNPVNHLKTALYFHITPTYSAMLQNDELYYHYTTFFNAGFSVAYKVISLGVQYRWCSTTTYDGISFNEDFIDDELNYNGLTERHSSDISTSTLRLILSLRF